MAVIKLGAIVTGIAGSIGGTTFRRTINGNSAYNKSNGPSRNTAKGNDSLQARRMVIQTWATLDGSQKQDWETVASTLLFPDKFGDLKNITGRQLFIKMSNRLVITDLAIRLNSPSNTTVPNVIQAFVVSQDSVPPFSATLRVTADDPLYIVWGVRRATPSTTKADFSRFVIGGFVEYTGTGGALQTFDVTAEFLAQVPNPTADTWYTHIAFPQNDQGFRAAAISGVQKVNGVP